MICESVETLQRSFRLDSRLCRLDYHLLRHMYNHMPQCFSYDIEIVLTDDSNAISQRCMLRDLTTDPELGRKWLLLMADGLVTPVTAADVMENLLSDL